MTAQPNATKIESLTRRARAVQMVAEDTLTDDVIAERVGVHKVTLERWKLRPDFQADVARVVEKMKARLLAKGIAERQNRIDALNDRWDRMRTVIAERATDDTLEAPGSSTGLLVRQMRVIGVGKAAQVVEEYAVDTGLLRELREHEKQAAQELGEWTEKREHTGKDGGPIEVGLSFMDLIRMARQARQAQLESGRDSSGD